MNQKMENCLNLFQHSHNYQLLERPLDFAASNLSEDLKKMQEKISITQKIIYDLEVLLGNVQIEISNSINLVENVLKKNQLVQFNNKQSSLQDFMSQNWVVIQREDLMLQTNSKQYEERVLTDHQTALNILERALAIIQKFISREQDINLRDPAQRDSQELSQCLNKRQPLQQRATFENMKQIRQKILKVIQESINILKTYFMILAQLEKVHLIFQQQIEDNIVSRNTNLQKIKVDNDFLDMKREDVKRYAQKRQDQNETFAYQFAKFQDLKKYVFN
ncbi:unnamed protein product [Paramecium pentaurelia]|uniref:Uncharacterized protein n=1 Tax=Paramecium pentaurelia TaxID=43138 RepID=A0A8S1YI32_9CILI|nr:unnamed protein product [Paramecium pentaurelia]